MDRAAYVALVWSPKDDAARARAAALGVRMSAEAGWRPVGATDRSLLWTGGAAPPPVRALPLSAGFIIGDLFPNPGASETGAAWRASCAAERRPAAMARDLSSNHWGRYVALLHGSPPCETAVFRDPSGHLDCLVWPLRDGLWAVGSDPRAPPPYLRPPHLFLNWDRIGRYMAIPSADTTTPLFDGIDGVGPGDLWAVGAKAAPVAIWSPAAFANAETSDPIGAGEELVCRVDRCTAALAEGHDALLFELSGGLDSAIVAAAMGATGRAAQVGQWLNRIGDRRESDERAYAQAVTDRLGVALTAVAKPRTAVALEDLSEMAGTVWPSITASDVGTDRDAVARLRATGATGMVSGQGGDAVFFQMPSALVAADAFRRDGLSTLWSPLLADVARRARKSVWGVLAEVSAALRHRTPPLMPTFPLVHRDVAADAAGAVHRWVTLAREADVTPAKALQIEALANCHMFHSDSRRRRQADLLYPLLAQPVVELCLTIGAPELAGGAFDRAFTRKVFAERLPQAVRERRTKGAMGSFFTHLVADSLPNFRPFLLDGCLCDARVLDRAQVERLLDPQQLIWTSSATEILWAVTVEAWVRHWQRWVPDSPAAPRLTAMSALA